MDITAEIENHIASQTEAKGSDLRELHMLMQQRFPKERQWFDDGRNEAGKVVTNPTIGYGSQILKYANGDTKEFFRIGISVTSTGISVYILGLKDKKHLSEAYGKRIGKASVTGYCIKFKKLADIDINVLEEAIRFGMEYND